jgi:ribosomal protein S3AE
LVHHVGISMFTAIVKSEFDSDKKVFLEQNLKEIGTQVNTKDGNACRVQVIGITSSNQIKPEELDKNIRNVYNAKFE